MNKPPCARITGVSPIVGAWIGPPKIIRASTRLRPPAWAWGRFPRTWRTGAGSITGIPSAPEDGGLDDELLTGEEEEEERWQEEKQRNRLL